MSITVEERLRRYRDVLDEAAEQLGSSATNPPSQPRHEVPLPTGRSRRMRVIVAAVSVGVAAAAVAAIVWRTQSGGSNTPAPQVPATQPPATARPTTTQAATTTSTTTAPAPALGLDRYFLLDDAEVTSFQERHREVQWEPNGIEVALHWRDPDIDTWIEDRAASAQLIATPTMFDAELQIYDYGGRDRKITALWLSGDTTMEFHASPVTRRRFMRLLGQLRIVDGAEFNAALPPGSPD